MAQRTVKRKSYADIEDQYRRIRGGLDTAWNEGRINDRTYRQRVNRAAEIANRYQNRILSVYRGRQDIGRRYSTQFLMGLRTANAVG